MKKESTIPQTIDAYIADFPPEIQQSLTIMRATIRKAAPDAKEIISYAIPTFHLEGNLVHFAAYKNHIGFYPAASGVEAFKEALSAYKTSKGAVQFPVDEPLPVHLISKIVAYRVKENLEKAAIKRSAKKVKNK